MCKQNTPKAQVKTPGFKGNFIMETTFEMLY